MKNTVLMETIKRTLEEKRLFPNTFFLINKKTRDGYHDSDFGFILEFVKTGERLDRKVNGSIEADAYKGRTEAIVEKEIDIARLTKRCRKLLTVYTKAVERNGYDRPCIDGLSQWGHKEFIELYWTIRELPDYKEEK